MQKVSYLFLALLLALFVVPTSAYARNGVSSSQGSGTSGSVCQYSGTNAGDCNSCMSGGKHVWTAIGCLPTESGEFITKLLQAGSGIAGGIAFLLIVIGGFQIITSMGNPEKLNEGKELVTAAIVGLLFIVFSLFLLRLIGVDILGIPGFS